MLNTVHLNVSGATLFQLVAELVWLCFAVVLAIIVEAPGAIPIYDLLAPAAVFAVLMVFLNGAFGLYRRDQSLSLMTYVARLFFAMLVGAPIAYLGARVLPGGTELQHTLGQAILLAFCGLILVRHMIVSPIVRSLMPHRVLVLGTGPEAMVVGASLSATDPAGIHLVGYYPLEKVTDPVVSPTQVIAAGASLEETVRNLGVSEIIVAVRQQRGGVLPLRGLLECRLAGVQITDLARFFERVQGQIPIDALKASWLIYGNGFRQNWLRALIKRTFDIVVALVLLMATMPIIVLVAILIAIESGTPIVYRQQRVGLRGKPFELLKFRSMRPDAEKDGKAIWAAVGDSRVTPLGRFLRRTRVDELPQLINVLRGEMSFVGPRPERPIFVEMLTERIPFYAVRHSVKPGITGWAQVRYSYGASVEQSVKKLQYDLYYVKNHSLFLDLLILLETVRVVLLGEGAR